MKSVSRSLIILLMGLLAGCVDLTTKKPIQVDIDMRLDVYQHAPNTNTASDKSSVKNVPEGTAEEKRRNRFAEVQSIKNSELIGENHEGLLTILKLPPGNYGEYVRKIVNDENADRLQLMKKLADDQKTAPAEIQKKQAQLWRDKAFKGEWIEVPDQKGGYTWTQKQG